MLPRLVSSLPIVRSSPPASGYVPQAGLLPLLPEAHLILKSDGMGALLQQGRLQPTRILPPLLPAAYLVLERDMMRALLQQGRLQPAGVCIGLLRGVVVIDGVPVERSGRQQPQENTSIAASQGAR